MEAEELLKLNFSMFRKMKELAEDQEILLNEDRMDKYHNLANKRERLRTDITANNRRYSSLVKHDSFGRSKSKGITDEIAEVIRSIQEIDKRIEGLILDGKQRLLTDISKMRKGRNALRNYRGKAGNIPRFIEKKG